MAEKLRNWQKKTQYGLRHIELTTYSSRDSHASGINSSVRFRRYSHPLGHDLGREQISKRIPKLSAHGTVQDEVDGAVHEREEVHKLSEIQIHIVEERFAEDAAEEGHDSRRELGDEEEEQDGQQHPSGPVVSPVVLDPVLEPLLPLVGFVQHLDQPETQAGERDARDQLGEHAEYPEVDLLQGLVVALGDLAEVHAVQHLAVLLLLDDGESEVYRQTEQRAVEVRAEDGALGTGHAAPGLAGRRETDGQEPPDGQGDGKPRGYGVADDREVGVEQSEHCPTVRELLLRGLTDPDIIVDAVRDVGDHDEHVGEGQSGEYGVGRRDHVFPCEHNDVEDVCENPENAHDDG